MSTVNRNSNISPVPMSLPVTDPQISNDDYGIKTASPDIILIPTDSLPVDLMTELIFENIGGKEIINIARHDLINGQPVAYSPIKGLPLLEYQLDPNTIIGLQKTAPETFLNFPIKYESFLPEYVDISGEPNIYYDANLRGIVIEVTNSNNNERVELQIASAATLLDDTIYTNIELFTEES